MELFKTKKFIVITGLVVLSLIGVIIYSLSKNPYGDELTIANLGDYTTDRPAILNAIKHNLHKTVSLNVDHKIESNSIDDVVIRKDSFSQEFNKKQGVHTVKFIVDIASIRQSYKVSYQWVDDKKSFKYMSEYGTEIACLPIDLLIYGDFKCKDDRIIEMGVENYDPISRLLPYHVESKYKITEYEKNGDLIVLTVEAYAPGWVAGIDQKLLDQYSREIKTWIKSRKLNPDDYTLRFIY